MNSDYFSQIGWISLVVWFIVPLLWIFYAIKGPRRWLCPIALILTLVALVLAKDNSNNYVNLIQPDRSAEIAAEKARQEASLQALKESRGNDLSDVRFAEDDAGDTLDRAGMDKEDLKYLDQQLDSLTPDWKKEKRSRTEGGVDDGSIDSAIGGGNAIEAADSEVLDGMEEKVPVVMLEKDLAMAHRLDALNLNIIYFLIGLAILMFVIDYLKRANIYGKASLPLPIPSAWLNSLTPLPPVVERPSSGSAELATLAKRGDSFIYFTDKKEDAAKIPEFYTRLSLRERRADVLRADGQQGSLDDDFIFEAVWYGRSSFVVDSAARSEKLLDRFIELLVKRKATRARVSQSVHLVYDLSYPMDEARKEQLASLAKATGLSLILCGDSSTS